MDYSTLLGIAFLLICVLFIFLLVAIAKINSLHKKVTDVSPKDLYPFMEEMRELVIESERVADKLEDAIRVKEEMLEDITSLVDEKLKRLETIEDPAPQAPRHRSQTEQQTAAYEEPAQEPIRFQSTGTIRSRIAEMIRMGLSDAEIAAKLSVSTTEVQIVRKMELD